MKNVNVVRYFRNKMINSSVRIKKNKISNFGGLIKCNNAVGVNLKIVRRSIILYPVEHFIANCLQV